MRCRHARYRNRSGAVKLVGRDRLLFARGRVQIGVTKFPPKNKRHFGLMFCSKMQYTWARILWVATSTALFKPPNILKIVDPPPQGSDLSSFRNKNLDSKDQGMCQVWGGGYLFRISKATGRSSSRDRSVACCCCCDGRRSCTAAAATELLSSSSLLEVQPAARSWQHLEEGRDAQNDETTL